MNHDQIRAALDRLVDAIALISEPDSDTGEAKAWVHVEAYEAARAALDGTTEADDVRHTRTKRPGVVCCNGCGAPLVLRASGWWRCPTEIASHRLDGTTEAGQ